MKIVICDEVNFQKVLRKKLEEHYGALEVEIEIEGIAGKIEG